MAVSLTIDKAGRIVVPKPMRDALHLRPGSVLEIERHEDSIILRQPRVAAVMKQKNGFWIFDTGGQITPETVNKTLSENQAEQDRRIVSE